LYSGYKIKENEAVSLGSQGLCFEMPSSLTPAAPAPGSTGRLQQGLPPSQRAQRCTAAPHRA